MEPLPGIVIPAYQPGPELPELVTALLEDDYPCIVVVNDGCDDALRPLFERLASLPRVEVVEHLVNLGKGEALKTGLNHLFVRHPEPLGAVTVDADGQHLPRDVKAVARCLVENPEDLCLGARSFEGPVPWKSRLGNTTSRWVLRLLSGQRLRDTQTGLRGIPRSFVPDLLPLRTGGYEFELEMLFRASERGRCVREVPIETVYRDGNVATHFDPLWDSLRVYFVFFRFLVSSLLTATIDFSVFTLFYALGTSLLASMAAARLVAGVFNFLVNQRIVFKEGRHPAAEALKYVTLVLALMTISYTLTLTLIERFGTNVYLARVLVEGSLFLASFAVQRVYVFASGGGGGPGTAARGGRTDWDAYYARTARTARLTRRITARKLLRRLREGRAGHVLELGGGDSCFYDAIRRALHPERYSIIDDNARGIALFERRTAGDPGVRALRKDVLDPGDDLPPADVCFSVGLIEHFDEAGTKEAIDAHFARTRPGGLVVLMFSTPTWLYRAARRVLEAAGLWRFPDERPVPVEEVLRAVQGRGRVTHVGVNWWIVLTQGVVAVETPGAA